MKCQIHFVSVDELHYIREWVVAVINGQPDIQVEAQASNGHEAGECFVRHRPDITLMDLTLAELSASLVHQVNEPLTSILPNAQAPDRLLTSDAPTPFETTAYIYPN